MLVDYHVHVVAHGEYTYSTEWIKNYLSQAQTMGVGQIGFCEHDWYIDEIDFSAVRRAHQQDFTSMRVRIGLEVDYKPGRENEIASLLAKKSFDYVIGSIHHIGDWMFDHPDHKHEFQEKNIDVVYDEYFKLVGQAIRSGLFDIIGHLDLVKIWGHRPLQRPVTSFLDPILKEMHAEGVVVEVNSAGLRKPVGEIYPSRDLLEQLFNANIPITFGSDAHHPDDVGAGLREGMKLAREAGYRTVVGFNRRQKVLGPMG